MYSAEQIPALNKIIYLRDSGFHIAEIAAVPDSEDNLLIADQLDRKYDGIEKIIQAEQEKSKKIKLAFRGMMKTAGSAVMILNT